MNGYDFATRTAAQDGENDDELDYLREAVADLTETVADLVDDADGVDLDGNAASCSCGPARGGEDLAGYVANAGAMRQIEEREDGGSPVHRTGPSRREREQARNVGGDVDVGYVERAGALNQSDEG